MNNKERHFQDIIYLLIKKHKSADVYTLKSLNPIADFEKMLKYKQKAFNVELFEIMVNHGKDTKNLYVKFDEAYEVALEEANKIFNPYYLLLMNYTFVRLKHGWNIYIREVEKYLEELK